MICILRRDGRYTSRGCGAIVIAAAQAPFQQHMALISVCAGCLPRLSGGLRCQSDELHTAAHQRWQLVGAMQQRREWGGAEILVRAHILVGGADVGQQDGLVYRWKEEGGPAVRHHGHIA
eukprot:2846890-Pyramimonas_sp.AAC.1